MQSIKKKTERLIAEYSDTPDIQSVLETPKHAECLETRKRSFTLLHAYLGVYVGADLKKLPRHRLLVAVAHG